MSEKIYTKEQLQKIINKATKLQNEDFKADLENAQGFTLSELEKIGSEVGLKKEYLHAAAFEFEQNFENQSSHINSTHIFEQNELPVIMTSDIWEQICSELRNYFDSYGKITEDPKRLEWKHMSLAGIETVLNITAFNESTRVNLSQRVGLGNSYTEATGYGFIVALIMTIIIVAGFDLSTPLIFATFFTSWVPLWLIIFGLDVAWRKKKHSELKKLTKKVSNVIYKNRDQNRLRKLRLETELAEKTVQNDLSNILLDDDDEESNMHKSKRESI